MSTAADSAAERCHVVWHDTDLEIEGPGRRRAQGAVRAALARSRAADADDAGPRRRPARPAGRSGGARHRQSGGGQAVAALLRDAAVSDPQRRPSASGSPRPISCRPIRSARRLLRAARRGVRRAPAAALAQRLHSRRSRCSNRNYGSMLRAGRARSTSARTASCTPRPWSWTASGRSSARPTSIIAACCSTMRSMPW